jgi:hypothetical protein
LTYSQAIFFLIQRPLSGIPRRLMAQRLQIFLKPNENRHPSSSDGGSIALCAARLGQRGIGGTWSRTWRFDLRGTRHKQTRLDTAALLRVLSSLPPSQWYVCSLSASRFTAHFCHIVHSFLAVTAQKVSFQMISQVETSPGM